MKASAFMVCLVEARLFHDTPALCRRLSLCGEMNRLQRLKAGYVIQFQAAVGTTFTVISVVI